jgi:hypothetical protein
MCLNSSLRQPACAIGRICSDSKSIGVDTTIPTPTETSALLTLQQRLIRNSTEDTYDADNDGGEEPEGVPIRGRSKQAFEVRFTAP